MVDDIRLDSFFDLYFHGGDFKTGESELQETACILQSNQGDWKEDPLMGPNLIQLINSSASEDEFTRRIKLHIERDGKDYNEIKKILQLKLNRQ